MFLLVVLIVVLFGMFVMIFGYMFFDVFGFFWVLLVFGMVMYVWGGRFFFVGVVSEFWVCKFGMMLFIGFVIMVVFLVLWGVSFGIFYYEFDFWWEFVFLIVIMLFGYWIEMCFFV